MFTLLARVACLISLSIIGDKEWGGSVTNSTKFPESNRYDL